jgi:pteridine reductase
MAQESPVALITGAGKKRIGWHIAQALAERGYRLALHYRTSQSEAEKTVRELEERGVKAIAVGADLREEAQVQQLVEATSKSFGQIDVLVNAAAIWNRKKLEAVTADDVREHFDTNTLGTFLMCQRVGLAMTAQASGGTIINIGDWAEVRPYLDYAAYFPSKGGVTTLTRSMAVELGTRNPRVRVNAILPGPVMLPPDLPEAERAEAINATLVKREGSPRNVVLAALHFIDNDFVTGTCLPVDGGRTIYAG